MLWLAYNELTGEGRVFVCERHARKYAKKRKWKQIWIGLVA